MESIFCRNPGSFKLKITSFITSEAETVMREDVPPQIKADCCPSGILGRVLPAVLLLCITGQLQKQEEAQVAFVFFLGF